ncbi:MAG: hypothetical protein JWN04_6247, partial [Myxococcaceae bacterium]|nr:hypothetical protein [Myxococcaceae bacterium]
MRRTSAVCWLLLLFVTPGCSRDALADGRALRSRPRAPSARAEVPAQAKPSASVAQLLITDRAALQVIEQTVGDLGKLAFDVGPRADNATLWKNAAYRALMERIASDVRAIGARDPLAGVGIRGHAHRLFDERFLRAAAAHFELVAVTNRMDRHFFNPTACGELRLVYRLAYRQSAGDVALASRLPMTIALELKADPVDAPSDCAIAASRWMTPAGTGGRALGSLLTAESGPLAPRQVTRARVVQLVSNLQTVRWPSAVRPDLGGHAEYALRAFAWDAASGSYRSRKLENTPDVPRLTSKPVLKKKLLQWLVEPGRVAQIDSANVRLPDEFLAELAVSVTPRGLARRANRPFRSLFEPALFASLDLKTLRFARSPEALLRRLDDLTCSGCHQSRSIAGFHLLGEDALDDNAGNTLATGSSPHTRAELKR